MLPYRRFPNPWATAPKGNFSSVNYFLPSFYFEESIEALWKMRERCWTRIGIFTNHQYSASSLRSNLLRGWDMKLYSILSSFNKFNIDLQFVQVESHSYSTPSSSNTASLTIKSTNGTLLSTEKLGLEYYQYRKLSGDVLFMVKRGWIVK